MEAKFEVPSEVAREWARKRWAKPNARHREARRKVLARLAAARADGDLAVAAVMMNEVFEAATLMLGRHRLIDERISLGALLSDQVNGGRASEVSERLGGAGDAHKHAVRLDSARI